MTSLGELMSNMMDNFWESIDALLDEIESEKPDTAQAVVSILNKYHAPSSGAAFFAGSGGDRQLLSALGVAGWRVEKIEEWYYYVARHSETNDVLTYVEGDVYIGDKMLEWGE